ncbi:MAG: LysM domain-containing protein [Pseudomonadota bacterium]|nr:LysM domain-containing protein [Pseudomonadota bacterium]MDP1903222.1 LysM domain-containing protein [Pseudomonadota bacterium]MDP2352731.1 LysM domain-containing protein [Pseudomonadota bacterium]
MTINQNWKNTVDDGINNAAWDAYDTIIHNEVGDMICSADQHYNARFIENAYHTKYTGVDWKLMKAILWVESGGPRNSAWTTRPMQIGNKGDPAYDVLKRGADDSSIIMASDLLSTIKTQSIDQPELNIRTGIAYLFTRMAYFDTDTVFDPDDAKVYLEVVQQGDSLEKIGKRVGTTVDVLASLRKLGKSKTLQPGEKLQYRKATLQRVIKSWRTWDYQNIAARYNGGGDPAYAEKLEYVHATLFPKLVR